MNEHGRVLFDLRPFRRRTADSPADGSPPNGTRSIALELAIALERLAPELVSAYLLPPAPGADERKALGPLYDSGRASLALPAVPPGAQAGSYLCAFPFEVTEPLYELRPRLVDETGLRFVTLVDQEACQRLTLARTAGPAERRVYTAHAELVRHSDAVLVSSYSVASELAALLGPPGPFRVIGDGGHSGDPLSNKFVREVADLLADLSARPPHAWRRRPAVAIVSPLPPIASGIASYSARLTEALLRLARTTGGGPEITCFADGRDRNSAPVEGPSDVVVGDARGFRRWDHLSGGFDRVVYALGNSEYHTGALSSLRRRPGFVLAHEVTFANLLRFSAWRYGAVPGGFRRTAIRNYGKGVLGAVKADDSIERDVAESRSLLFFHEVTRTASAVAVHSESARQLALRDARGARDATVVCVLPFALAMSEHDLAAVRAARARARSSGRRPQTIASFGVVDPSKRPDVLLGAVKALVDGGADVALALVGPVSAELRTQLEHQAERLGLSERLSLTGSIPQVQFLEWLGRADVAVQLRSGFSGEASKAVGDCLAAGLPTIVTRIGWMGELPEDCVVKVEMDDEEPEVAAAVARLLADGDERARLALSASEYAVSQSYDRVAGHLLAELHLADGDGWRRPVQPSQPTDRLTER